MDLVRWDPFREMTSLRDAMDRLFEESFVRPSRFWPDYLGRGELPVDMYQTANDVVVKASLPGVKPEEVDITVSGDTLTIKGEHKEEQEVKQEDYFRKERYYGAFSRSLILPVQVQSDKAEAVFEDGILTLTIPKVEEVKPKQIKIKTRKVIEAAKK
jgi:HSP20 family protein